MARSEAVQVRTSQFESRRRHREVNGYCDATIPSFSGGNDAQDSRVDWAAGRGHRPGTRRLDCDWCHGRSTFSTPRPARSLPRLAYGHQRDQLRSADQRQFGGPQHGPNECEPGEFRRRAARHGVTTTYTNTPFQISFLPASYGSTSVSGDSPVVVSGVLNGMVSGPSTSTVTATLNAPPSGLIGLGGGSRPISACRPARSCWLPRPPTAARPPCRAWSRSAPPLGSTVTTAPEPSTIALFLTTVGGLGLRRYVLSRRRSARV